MVHVRFNEILPANSSDCCFRCTLQRHNRTAPGRPVKHIEINRLHNLTCRSLCYMCKDYDSHSVSFTVT